MKKILVLALAIVMALSVVALVACDQGETVTGSTSYKYNDTTTYGAKVDVTVKGGVITAVKLYSEEDTGWVRTSSGWKSTEDGGWGMNEGDLGHDAAEAAYTEWINNTFVGKTVDEVKAYKATITPNGTATTLTVETASANLAGATQSAARIIVAVQDALSHLGAAK